MHISVAAESRWLVLSRTGSHRGRHFLGVFGTWIPLPAFPSLPSLQRAWPFEMCREGAPMPHELFAMACVCAFVIARFVPSFCMRNAVCSLTAVRSGRLWTLLCSNIVHFAPFHLVNSLIQTLHLGPLIHASLGCERTAALLLCASLAASTSSLVWHGIIRGRADEGSIGGSGVAMALVAANAVLYPRIIVHVYGLEVPASALPLVYLLTDVLAVRRFTILITCLSIHPYQ